MNTQNDTPASRSAMLQDLHDELYRAQRTSSAEVMVHSVGRARLLLSRYRDSLAAIDARGQECWCNGSRACGRPCHPDAPREEATAASAETPSAKQQKLLTLADRIDHEELWRWAGMDHHKMTPEQRDRMNAGVALRRYARLWAPGHWVVFPPIGPVSFSANTLDKAVEMARRSPPPAAPEPDDTPLETGEADAR